MDYFNAYESTIWAISCEIHVVSTTGYTYKQAINDHLYWNLLNDIFEL